MPVTWMIEPERQLVHIRYVDSVDAENWQRVIEGVLKDRNFRPGFRWLVDRRHATTPSTSFAADILAVLDNHRDQLGNARVALVIQRQSTDFAMARMQVSLNDFVGLSTRIFHSEAEAVAWLTDPQASR